MTTPAEVKFALDRQLLAFANERGLVPMIMDVHSVVVEGNVVHAGYDIGDEVLFFEFERPQLVSPDDVRAFVSWLAWGDHGATIH